MREYASNIRCSGYSESRGEIELTLTAEFQKQTLIFLVTIHEGGDIVVDERNLTLHFDEDVDEANYYVDGNSAVYLTEEEFDETTGAVKEYARRARNYLENLRDAAFRDVLDGKHN